MTTDAVEIQGILQEDGSLVLEKKLNLPPGRVKVTVQPIADFHQTDVWQFFQRIKAEREAHGITPRSQEEIDAYLATMRDDGEPGHTI